jgi:hypothetical protein
MNRSIVRTLFDGSQRRRLALWVAAAAIGAFLGYEIAYYSAIGGLGGLSAITAGVIAILIIAVLLVSAAGSARNPDPSARPLARTTFAAASLLAAGVGVGWAIAPVLRPELRAPVVLEAVGAMSLALVGIEGYSDTGITTAICRSQPNGVGIASVEANGVGAVGTVQVAASLSFTPTASPPPVGVLAWIHGEPIETMWQASSEHVEQTGAARSGQVDFAKAVLISEGEPGRPAGGWPAEVSGSVVWSCGDWD